MKRPIPPDLVRAQADDLHGVVLTAARAAEIAAELDALLRGTAAAAGTDFLADPEDLRAVLWELRERAP